MGFVLERRNMGKENLTRRIDSEEAREMGRKSGEARRAKRDARLIAQRIMDLQLYPGDKAIDVEDVQALAELKGQNVSVREAIIIAQAQNALKGDRDAASFLIATSGEKPADKIDVGMTVEEYVKSHKVKL